MRRSFAHTYEIWRSTLQRISKSDEVEGIEKRACVLFQWLRIVSISHRLIHTWDGIEGYVLAKLVILLVLLFLVDYLWVWVVLLITIYLLFELYLALFQIGFLTKFVEKPKSVERSLLLFIINIAEVVIAFAIFYRVKFGLGVGEAIENSILVFGTIGFRKDEIVDTSSIVSVQIVLDFLLLAVFLATLIGRVGPFGKDRE